VSNSDTQNSLEGIAIIGMSGQFPGAKNIDKFWHNLRNGIESVSYFTEQELAHAGVDAAVLKDPNYVKAKAVLEDIELFDASFFGVSSWSVLGQRLKMLAITLKPSKVQLVFMLGQAA